MKTIKEHLEELPPGYRERALANLASTQGEAEADNIASALLGGFTWKDTPEGGRFWDQLHNHYVAVDRGEGDLVPVPALPGITPPVVPELHETDVVPAKAEQCDCPLPPHFRAETAARVLAGLANRAPADHEDWLAKRAVKLTDSLIKQLTS